MSGQDKSAKKRRQKASFWVGLGASAGGLEALRGLVRNLPTDLPAAYFVVQHLGPHHKSMLVDIIGRETEMPVLEITDDLLPQSNTVYITPPNSDLVAEKNRIHLTEPSKQVAAPKPSVNRFLKTLAIHKKSKAVGVILSGTGSDGSIGIEAIREHGGITIAQDELTAKYSSMPTSAMETGAVDLVMSAEEIGGQFSKIVKLPRDLNALRVTPLSFDGVSELIRLLHKHTKVNFRHYKTATFQRRVERRMVATKCDDLESYTKLAHSSSKEVDALFRDLLISVTSFFRDPVEFESLTKHLEKIVDEKNGEPIRVWIPGTATGEEAYSIAILFSEAIRRSKAGQHSSLQIFATDIDIQAIDVGRKGFYPESAMEQVPTKFIDKYFDKVTSGYSVKKALREKIVFSIHSVAQDAPFLNIDMISCRNLLIYFQTSLQAEVFNRFHYSLVPHGLLFLGKSEATSASEDMYRLAPREKHIFYQKPYYTSKAATGLTYDLPGITEPRKKPYPSIEMQQLENANIRFESLVTSLGPNGFLIGKDMTIKRAFGNVERYTGMTAGNIDTTVRSLLAEPFRQDILASAPGVIRNDTPHIGHPRAYSDIPRLQESMTIYPVKGGVDGEIDALVLFKRVAGDETKSDNYTTTDSSNALREQVDILTNELAIAKDNLQQTVEELETSNEELQALNEELQSSNEELQSTNEELETSNEELQSTNEELSTVNEELHVNTHQLSVVNRSLNSILENVALPMLVVDRDLHITSASRLAETYFDIDSGLTQPHIGNCNMGADYPDLADLLATSMRAGDAVNVHIDDHKENGLLKIVPRFDDNGEIIGAIIVVSDNTERLKSARNELQLIFDNVPVGITARNAEGEIIRTNKMASYLFRYDTVEATGTKFYNYFEPELGKQIQKLDQQALQTRKPVTGLVMNLTDLDGHNIWARMSHIPVLDPMLGEAVIYSVTQNITEDHYREEKLKNTLAELARSNEELNRFSYICSHDMKEPVRLIQAMTSLLVDPNFEADDTKRMEVLTRINTNTHRLGSIIDSLLAYSRIDAKVEFDDVDINEILSQVTESLSLVIQEQGAQIEIDDMPVLQGAHIHFTQLFQNLIGNALKFCDKECPIVRVKSTKVDNDWKFLVEDNGPGVAKKSREEIFNLFSRLNRRDEVEGSGLGLSIVQRIVAQYGGTIECIESELGGAGFSISLPDTKFFQISSVDAEHTSNNM